MKLVLVTRPTPTKVVQSVCTLEEITAADHAELHRDLQTTLHAAASKVVPFHIQELEKAVLLSLPSMGGVQ